MKVGSPDEMSVGGCVINEEELLNADTGEKVWFNDIVEFKFSKVKFKGEFSVEEVVELLAGDVTDGVMSSSEIYIDVVVDIESVDDRAVSIEGV